MPRGLPRPRRGGRGSASPLHRWGGASPVWPMPARMGSNRSASCRGQAVPDPPARRAGNHHRHRVRIRIMAGWAPVRPGLKPRAESTSPLKGAARGHHPAQRAEADSPPRGAVRQPAEAGSENDPGGFRPARSPTPWGSRERGREDDDAAAARRTDPRRPICAVPFAAPPRCGTQRGASPLQGGRIFPAATPDPPARLGRNRRRDRVPTVACAIPAGMVAGTVVAAPTARRARQRLAPTQLGQHAGGGIGRPGGGG
jgi:hypothetical protein